MKFAALIATASALWTSKPQKSSLAQKSKRLELSFAQLKSAIGQAGDNTYDVFMWFDRDGSGAVDVYEFIFGFGWLCGYNEYEPTEEDIEALTEFW